jgi:DNA (cytosine-5)-methyltransferase 1
MKKLKALSFFSGAMGMDIGLERAGIDVVLACESEKFIRETIRLNRPNLKIIEDINKYSSSEIKKLSGLKKNEKVDLIVGGPPCQAFSTAGKRLSIKESRGQVFLKFLEVIKDLKPKYFVIENVRGLLSVPLNKSGKKIKGGTFKFIIDYLENCGYKISFELYNSANFGSPQIRERVVIIGNKKNKLPYLTPTHSNEEKYGLKSWRTFKDACNGLHNTKHNHVNFPEKRLKYFRFLKEGQNWRNLPINLQKKAMGKSYFLGGGKTGFLRRLSWSKPAPTLVTDPTMPATDLAHPNKDRPLSVEEYKRIQEFPDSWKIFGNIRQQYKQIGNAIPVSLGHAIGKLIMNDLNKKKINIIDNFRYSRYLNTSDATWQKSLDTKNLSKQKSFNF